MKRHMYQSRKINCSYQPDTYYVNIADTFIDEFCSRFGLNKSDFNIDEELIHYTEALDETRISIFLKDAGLRLYEIVLQFSRTAKRVTSGQGWKHGIWYINFPEDNVNVSKLVDELDRKPLFTSIWFLGRKKHGPMQRCGGRLILIQKNLKTCGADG